MSSVVVVYGVLSVCNRAWLRTLRGYASIPSSCAERGRVHHYIAVYVVVHGTRGCTILLYTPLYRVHRVVLVGEVRTADVLRMSALLGYVVVAVATRWVPSAAFGGK